MATKKILIVEDETPILKLLTEKLERKGYEVLVALDGKEGLKACEDERPDLILLDIIMPVMDGITMLRKLREKEWGKSIEVIILTNLSDETKTAEAIELGTKEYLVKTNWSLDDLLDKVAEKIG